MSRRTMLGLGGGGAMAAALGGCGYYYGTYNFLWTVTVRVGDELRSGSAVYQLKPYNPILGGNIGLEQRGVSPVIDLGERGLLIALYRPDVTLMPHHGDGHDTPLSPLTLVRYTYLRDVEGWRGGHKCEEGAYIGCLLSSLNNAKRVDAPDGLEPLFAYAAHEAEAMEDVKSYFANELSIGLGPDVSYVNTKIEPTWYWVSTRQQFKATWFRKSRLDNAPRPLPRLTEEEATNRRVADYEFGGDF